MVKYWLHLDGYNNDVRELSREDARKLLVGSTPWPELRGFPGERFRCTSLGLQLEVRYVR